MIKLIIFDLDGVLVDAREIHYEALNQALSDIDEKYSINRTEHLSTYDGLPTKTKLNMLHAKKGLPAENFNEVWKKKQEKTLDIISKMGPNNRLAAVLSELSKDYILYCCSNSVFASIQAMLTQTGLIEHFAGIISNEDVRKPKPSPEMYMRTMLINGVSPKETLIIEDSHLGRKAALDSGAHLLGVRNSSDVTLENIRNKIYEIETGRGYYIPWDGGNMNVLIPMAGQGSRFADAGYTFPKPLIEVNGKPMIQVIVENINIKARHIYIVQKSQREKYNLDYLLKLITPDGNCAIVEVDGPHGGAAVATLLAKDLINNDSSLLIANSDQYVEWNSNEFMYAMSADEIDGGILTFQNTHPKWSYAKIGDNGFICEVAEKKPISDKATVGIYYWKHGSDYVKYAEQMISKDIRTNGEFYVCPVFNEAIQDGKLIRDYQIDKMWGLGTPEDLENYINR